MQTDSQQSPFTKLNSKGIKDSHIRPGTLNLTEENVGDSLELIGTGKDILNRTLLAQALRTTINKGDLIKLKMYISKNTVI